MPSSQTIDQLDVAFDDPHAIANAGLLLPATLAERLGIEQAADALIDLGERPGAAWPGRKLLTLVHGAGSAALHPHTRPDRTPDTTLGWSAARRPLRPARHSLGRTTQPLNDQQPTLTRHLLRLRRHPTRAPARRALGRIKKPATALADRWIQAQCTRPRWCC